MAHCAVTILVLLSPVLVIAEDSPAEIALRARDTDKDGLVTVEEFVAADKAKEAPLRRDFRVFDADGDGRLSEAEFRSMPYWGTDDQRGPIADPIVDLAQSHKKRLLERWGDWNKDQDGGLSVAEFAAAKLPDQVAGLEGTQFSDWDHNGDNSISEDEAGLLLEIAFGVKVFTGELVRSSTGSVVDLRMLRNLHPDANWKIRREDYIKAMGSEDAAVKWFPSIKSDSDERFSVTEFMASGHRTDPVRAFLDLDRDLNARLSREEMENLPQGWGPPGRNWLPGFDDDMDGEYSLREFQLLPHINLLTSWHSARDADGDGKLSLQEFRPATGVEVAALAVEYFRRLDVDRDGFLALAEWPFQTSHPEAKFASLDANSDSNLTLEEFLTEKALPEPRLRRDFLVFDANADGRMTLTEFLTIPHWVPEKFRTPIADPVVQLSEAKQAFVKQHWSEWDRDRDGSLSEAEFSNAAIGQQIPGLATTGFKDWDLLSHDGKVSLEEALRVIDVAFSVCAPTGERLRTISGEIPDWRSFRGLDSDGDGQVTRETYLSHLKSVPNAEAMYRSIVPNDADSFGITEFAAGPYRTNPVAMFLGMDVNLDARLTLEEITQVPADWGPPAKLWLPGFDDDGDGGYSLREFMLIPHVNLLAAWHTALDGNQDGELALEEFRFVPAPAMAALSAIYFRRLDTNQDQKLSLVEWPFRTSHPEAKFGLLDADGDGELTEKEFLAEGTLPPEQLRRDFQVFDSDRNGRLTRTEFLAIPHWVRDDLRVSPPDPVAQLAEGHFSKLQAKWTDWDLDRDGQLNTAEFRTAAFGRTIPGLEMTSFADWDQDHDDRLSQEETRQLLEIACGVRSPTGEFLRSAGTGRVVDWRGFLALKPDRDGKVPREAYVKMMTGSGSDPKYWFSQLFESDAAMFGVTEFATSNHRTDPVSQFLGMDKDLDGRLSPEEVKALPVGWGPPGKDWLPGFDDDGDGHYSLQEFRRIPQVNLLANWQSAQDRDHDGTLNPAEFQFLPAPALTTLCADYFRRLDADRDGKVSIAEWDFSFDPARAPRSIILAKRDLDGDGVLSFEESLGDLRRPQPGDRADLGQEAALVRFEEAFLRADANNDRKLDARELATDAGLEVVAPGASALSRKVPFAERPAVGESDSSRQTYLLVGFNAILLISVVIYLVRQPKRSS